MSAYTDNLSKKIWTLLCDGDDCFISDMALGPVQAQVIADQLSCHCAYRHNDGRFEFSICELSAQHPMDLILVDSNWRAAK